MTENLIVNGKTYKGAKAVAITNSDGEQKLYYTDAVRSINGATPDENGNVSVKLGVDDAELSEAVETALTEAKESGEFDGPVGPPGPTGVHVGPEAPTDGQTVWIDTNEEPEEDSGGNNSPIVVETAPPDFSANEGEEGHILNRTHYIDENGIVHKLSNKFIDADWMATSEDFIDPSIVIPEQKISGGMWNNPQMDIQPGIIYDVHINGVVYACEALNSSDGIILGNNTSMTLNDYPFCIFWAGGSAKGGFFFRDSNVLSDPIYMKVTGHSYTVYNKLPEEFLPEGVAIVPTAEVGQTIIVEEVDGNGKPTRWKSADLRDIIDNRLKELGVIEGSIE